MCRMFSVLLLLLISTISSCSHAASDSIKTPLTVVIFGATGDLTARKLYPAIYNLNQEGELDPNFTLVGIGRRDWDEQEFHSVVYEALNTFSRNKPSPQSWDLFKPHLIYHKANFTEDPDYASIKSLIESIAQEAGRRNNTIFYLATESIIFPVIIQLLHKHHLLEQDGSTYARVIIEKPFGEELNSAVALQAHITQFLDEDQIYRMDHYLGKEGVFKLLKFRFEDSAYEALLSRDYVQNVQITLSEAIGIGTRANFYEKTGHLRDVIQNHAMQLLAFATMDS